MNSWLPTRFEEFCYKLSRVQSILFSEEEEEKGRSTREILPVICVGSTARPIAAQHWYPEEGFDEVGDRTSRGTSRAGTDTAFSSLKWRQSRHCSPGIIVPTCGAVCGRTAIKCSERGMHPASQMIASHPPEWYCIRSTTHATRRQHSSEKLRRLF